MEKAYVSWAKRFILFHHKRHLADMGAPDIRASLTHLAVERQVTASTRKVALQALIFLYRHVRKRSSAQSVFPQI
jgi:Phage integrase, N-terminal SAM-like domain